MRRAYFDCRFGQLHVHNAVPSGGGFDELTSVICLHGAGQTARVFLPLLQPLGLARSVYALDLPGAGESDAASGVDATAAAVQAVVDFVTNMRIRRFDLVARAEACAAAMQVLEQRGAQVRRVVLVGSATPVKSGMQVTSLSLTEADAPDFGARLVQLLAGPT